MRVREWSNSNLAGLGFITLIVSFFALLTSLVVAEAHQSWEIYRITFVAFWIVSSAFVSFASWWLATEFLFDATELLSIRDWNIFSTKRGIGFIGLQAALIISTLMVLVLPRETVITANLLYLNQGSLIGLFLYSVWILTDHLKVSKPKKSKLAL